MKTIIHVNQHKVRAKEAAPLSVKTYKSNREARQVDIVVDDKVVATVKYQPDKPLPCGARVWIETFESVVVHSPDGDSSRGESVIG
jgi:hypothetical protein